VLLWPPPNGAAIVFIPCGDEVTYGVVQALVFLFLLPLLTASLPGQAQSSSKPKPQVIVIGVHGMELDVIRPLILKCQLPNLAHAGKNGVHGKLRTVDAPNCPPRPLDDVHHEWMSGCAADLRSAVTTV